MTPGCVGSTATTVAPRVEPKLDGNVVPPTTTRVGWASVNVLPPSVDFQTPTPGALGIAETAPAVVEEMPCTPRPSATQIVLPVGSNWSIVIWRTARFTKFALPPSGVQVSPSSVDL